jgi:hypothetical protein
MPGAAVARRSMPCAPKCKRRRADALAARAARASGIAMPPSHTITPFASHTHRQVDRKTRFPHPKHAGAGRIDSTSSLLQRLTESRGRNARVCPLEVTTRHNPGTRKRAVVHFRVRVVHSVMHKHGYNLPARALPHRIAAARCVSSTRPRSSSMTAATPTRTAAGREVSRAPAEWAIARAGQHAA